MSLLLTAVFENGFAEFYLPQVDNRSVPQEIKPHISGCEEDIVLPLEVWDGVWSMAESRSFKTTEAERPVGRVELVPGRLFNCELRDGRIFSLTVEEATEGNTRFSKFFLDGGVSYVTVGSGEGSLVRYANKFVSPKHAELDFSGESPVVRDLGSVNGVFVGGRRLTGERSLRYGDVIYIIGLKLVYLGSVLAVNNPRGQCTMASSFKPIRLPAPTQQEEAESDRETEEENFFLRATRRLERLDEKRFSIEKCPPRQKQRRQPLLFTIGPSFTMELYRSGAATEPMPHLLIIADEFAELKKEQPEFVRALVSAARVGRSLGVNLILATQKPSGVVDDEIWSNTRFRLCLRVADKQDSNEMLKRPDAAYITGTGRGFFQVGNDEIFEEFQSGWSGAPYEPDLPFTDDKNVKVELLNLVGKSGVPKQKKQKKSDNVQKETQLDAVVKYAARLAEENQVPPLRQIWLPPLPKKLYLEDLPPVKNPQGISLTLPIGLGDSPETQSQYPVSVDFLSDGHLLVCGAAGSGKTTLLQSLLYSAVSRCTPREINLYIADFSSRTMAVFSAMPHVGAVCFDGDDEKLESIFQLLQDTLEKRKRAFSEQGIGSFREYVAQADECPAVVFVIDNYLAFAENYDRYEDALAILSREGSGYGIYLVVSANASCDLRSRIRQNFTCGVGLQLPDRFEYEAAVGDRTEIIPEGRTSGRGLIKAPLPVEFQTALPVREEPGMSQAQTLRRVLSRMAGEGGGASARKVGRNLEHLNYRALMARPDVTGLPESRFILGLTAEGEEPVTVDLDQEYCYTVGGSGGTGKTNFLKVLALQASAKGAQVYVFDHPDGDLLPFARTQGLDGTAWDDESLFALMETVFVPAFTQRNQQVNAVRDAGGDVLTALSGQRRILLLINCMTDFIRAVYSQRFGMSDFFELALDKGRFHKIQFAAAITPDDWTDMARYQVMRQFAAMGRGLHLGGLFDQQSILRFELSAADSVRQLPPGAAYALNGEGRCVRLITPLSEEDTDDE